MFCRYFDFLTGCRAEYRCSLRDVTSAITPWMRRIHLDFRTLIGPSRALVHGSSFLWYALCIAATLSARFHGCCCCCRASLREVLCSRWMTCRILDERLAQLRERRSAFPDHSRPVRVAGRGDRLGYEGAGRDVALEESSARARRPMADVMEEEERLRSTELEQAKAQALNLENGLRLAQAAGSARSLPLDSRDPAEDRLAGALISILVASDFATVRTEELGDEQYRYHVAVDWPRLDDARGADRTAARRSAARGQRPATQVSCLRQRDLGLARRTAS